jgi:hypothetical protein
VTETFIKAEQVFLRGLFLAIWGWQTVFSLLGFRPHWGIAKW